jgi:hypothetical protein
MASPIFAGKLFEDRFCDPGRAQIIERLPGEEDKGGAEGITFSLAVPLNQPEPLQCFRNCKGFALINAVFGADIVEALMGRIAPGERKQDASRPLHCRRFIWGAGSLLPIGHIRFHG